MWQGGVLWFQNHLWWPGGCIFLIVFLLLQDLGQNLSQDLALMIGYVQPMWSSAIFASSTRFAPGSRSTMLHTVQITVVGWEVGSQIHKTPRKPGPVLFIVTWWITSVSFSSSDNQPCFDCFFLVKEAPCSQQSYISHHRAETLQWGWLALSTPDILLWLLKIKMI